MALHEWMQFAEITSGPIFCEVRKVGSIGTNLLTPQSVNLILKRRCRLVGLNPTDFNAHRLRSRFTTQAGQNGIPLIDNMHQSTHRSTQQAAGSTMSKSMLNTCLLKEIVSCRIAGPSQEEGMFVAANQP